MKRIFASLLCAVLILTSLPGDASAQQEIKTLTVAHQTQLHGNFFSEEFGNNTADIDVRSLIHDYPLTAWTGEGGWLINRSVVASTKQAQDTQGNVVHTIVLHKDLKYSDGSPIKAQDYLFTLLLLDSPELHAIGATTFSTGSIAGFEEYSSGRSKVFTGLRLVDDYTFTIAVVSESLPYYYEGSEIKGNPYPIKVLAPGAQVKDDGQGSYLDGDFSADILRQTILDPQTGYLSRPQVSSGPYRLVSYDTQTYTATLEINPNYKGNYQGQKPSIPRLVVHNILAGDIVGDLLEGRVGLVNKVSNGAVINQATGVDNRKDINSVNYPRTGAAFLAFAAERELPSSNKLRQAVAHLIDKKALSDTFLQGHGNPVYGYYGNGQWMVREKGDALKALNIYPFSVHAATAILEEEGWTLDEQGQPYGTNQPQDAKPRYRKTEAGLKPLILKMAITEENTAGTILADMLTQSAGKAGMQIVVSRMSPDDLLNQYYRKVPRDYDLIFIGSNFLYLFNPLLRYHSGTDYQGASNTSGLSSKPLFDMAVALFETKPGDRAAYLKNWMAFQELWVQLLPMVPLYSNDYYDLFSNDLLNYRPDRHWGWGAAILYARLKD